MELSRDGIKMAWDDVCASVVSSFSVQNFSDCAVTEFLFNVFERREEVSSNFTINLKY